MFNQLALRFKDCPKCGTEMKESKGIMTIAYECPKCKYSEARPN